MALEMRAGCEECSRALDMDGEAYICLVRMHVLHRLRRANEANLPELRRRIAAAAETAAPRASA